MNEMFRRAYEFHQQGKLQEALEYYEMCTDSEDIPQILSICGLLYKELGRYDQATNYLTQAVQRFDSDPGLFFHLATCYENLSLIDEAIQYYQKALALRQNHAATLNNLGHLYRKTGKIDQAADLIQKALELEVSPKILGNFSLVLQELGETDQALSVATQAANLSPESLDFRWNLGILQLLQQNFEEGWENYEAGIENGSRRMPALPIPRWHGNPLSHERLFIQSEQGLGDQILFSTCFGDLATLVQECTIECHPRLVSIFSRTWPELTFKKPDANLQFFDYRFEMGSLPSLFRKNQSCFPSELSHVIAATKEREEKWRSLLASLEGLKVGISWQGGNADEAWKRSTTLSDWYPTSHIPGIELINLQYGDLTLHLDEMNELGIHHWPQEDLTNDLENLCGLIGNLDLVITVSSTVAHLAAAMNKPVWLLLPYAPSWRWFLNISYSPWYPSVQIFRQEQRGDWTHVFEKVNQELRLNLKE
ncbi:MAG: tetratricopeptide repeat-containing glycosyltransferase family protein [Gammaproteobacteria bacterium]|nr:tetratricopeptide repeat-containing glycosyltransferase family protein [Gammaproteobacteria bacterium]MDH5693083.1 tetratricopeptide repeat-containing glycosyltransferase family protein [Gammaproteobacteria bacterium]